MYENTTQRNEMTLGPRSLLIGARPSDIPDLLTPAPNKASLWYDATLRAMRLMDDQGTITTLGAAGAPSPSPTPAPSPSNGIIPSGLLSFVQPDTSPRQLCVEKTTDKVNVWQPLNVPGVWLRNELTSQDGGPLRPNARAMQRIYQHYHPVYHPFTSNGTIYSVGAGDPRTYVGGAINYTITNTDNAQAAYFETEIEILGESSEVAVIYSTHPSSAWNEVTINGGVDLVNGRDVYIEAGFAFLDTYGATQTNKNVGVIATNLPRGKHTIRLAPSSFFHENRNPSQNRLNLNSIRVISTNNGLPLQEHTTPPPYVSGKSYQEHERVRVNGRLYYSTADGVSGGTPPSHEIAGEANAVADGPISWVYETFDVFGEDETYISRPVSEPIFAAWLSFDGETEEDFGGDQHENHRAATLRIAVDGLEQTMTDGERRYGSNIAVYQVSELYHSADPTTTVANDHFHCAFGPDGRMNVQGKIDPLFDYQLGQFYPWMVVLAHYDQVVRGYVARELEFPGVGRERISDNYGVANPKLGEDKALELAAYGSSLHVRPLSANTPSRSGDVAFSMVAGTTAAIMENFENAGATTYWDKNTDGSDVSNGGNSGMAVKGYWRANGSTPIQRTADDVFALRRIHGCSCRRELTQFSIWTFKKKPRPSGRGKYAAELSGRPIGRFPSPCGVEACEPWFRPYQPDAPRRSGLPWRGGRTFRTALATGSSVSFALGLVWRSAHARSLAVSAAGVLQAITFPVWIETGAVCDGPFEGVIIRPAKIDVLRDRGVVYRRLVCFGYIPSRKTGAAIQNGPTGGNVRKRDREREQGEKP